MQLVKKITLWLSSVTLCNKQTAAKLLILKIKLQQTQTFIQMHKAKNKIMCGYQEEKSISNAYW